MPNTPETRNTLFPVFLKLEKLNLLLVGGGNVACEKLTAILGNCPQARIKVVSIDLNTEMQQMLEDHKIPFSLRAFQESDCMGMDLAVIAIDDPQISAAIYESCRKQSVLSNVADKPALCDFYLGSIVQKGSLKIAISTNGKSPTIAKRIKETLQEAIPAEMENVLANLQIIRGRLGGDFQHKVKMLNEITSGLASGKDAVPIPGKGKYRSLSLAFLILGLIAGYFLAKI